MNNLIVSFFILMLSIIPLSSLAQLSTTTGNIERSLLVNSLSFGVYNLTLFVYLFIFALMSMVTYFGGDFFDFFKPLPLARTDIQVLSFLVFVRMYILQFSVALFTVPLVGFFLTRSPLFFLFALISNGVYLFFTVNLLVVIASFLARRVFNKNETSRFGTLVRVVVVFLYILSFMTLSFFSRILSTFYQVVSTVETIAGLDIALVNILLPFFFMPFAGGYFISLSIFPLDSLQGLTIGATLVGFVVMVAVMLLVSRSSIRSLAQTFSMRTLVYSSNQVVDENIEVRLNVTGPFQAYVRKTLSMAVRDFGSLASIMLAIVVPVVIAFSASTGLTDPFVMLFFYQSFIPVILYNGLAGNDDKMGGLLASLPYRNYDIYLARRVIMTLVGFLPVLILFVLDSVVMASGLDNVESALQALAIALVVSSSYLLTYSVLFGKSTSGFTMFAFNLSNKTMKNITIVVVQLVIVGINLGLVMLVASAAGINIILAVLLVTLSLVSMEEGLALIMFK